MSSYNSESRPRLQNELTGEPICISVLSDFSVCAFGLNQDNLFLSLKILAAKCSK